MKGRIRAGSKSCSGCLDSRVKLRARQRPSINAPHACHTPPIFSRDLPPPLRPQDRPSLLACSCASISVQQREPPETGKPGSDAE